MLYSNKNIVIALLSLALGGGRVLAQAPAISGLSSQQAVVGESLTLTGQNFPAANQLQLKLGSVSAEILAASGTQIKFRMPSGAWRAPLTLTHTGNQQTVYSAQALNPIFRGAAFEPGRMLNSLLGTAHSGLWQTTLADFDGDKKLDVAYSANASSVISVYRNTSATANPTFQAQALAVNLPTRGLASGDLNGDGRPELILGGHGGKGNTILIYPNQSTVGTISWGAPITYLLPSSGATRLEVYDLNGDGRAEIIVTDESVAKAYILPNTGSGTAISFDSNPLTISFPGSNLYGLQITDIDGDGAPDLVCANYLVGTIYASRNLSSGSLQFAEPIALINGITGAVEVKAGDLNGDNKPDLAWTDNLSNKVGYSLNQSTSGALQFSNPTEIAVAAKPRDLALADINGDGANDLVIHHTQGGTLTLLLNRENAQEFSSHQLAISGAGAGLSVGDVNGDARPDILYTNSAGNSLHLLMNQQCFAPKIIEKCASGGILLVADYSAYAAYQWNLDGVPLSGATESSWLATQTGEYSLSMTPWGGCTGTAVHELHSVSGLPGNPQFMAIEEVCAGETLSLKVEPAVSGATYYWQGTNGFAATTSSNSYQIPNASTSDAVDYRVTISTADCEAVLNAPATAVVNNLPEVSIVKTSSATCAGDAVSLEASSASAVAYQWKLNGQEINGATAQTLSTAEGGNYSVRVRSAQGCESESGVYTFTPPQAIAPNFTVDAVACVNVSVQFTNQTAQPSGGQTLYYRWNFGDGSPVSTDKNPTHTYTSTVGSPYTVRLQVGYGPSLSCAQISTQTIQVAPRPTVSITAEQTQFCEGETTQLSINSDQNIVAVSWSDGQSGESITTGAGGELTAEVLTEAGCTVSASINLIQLPLPQLSVGAEKQQLKPGESTQLSAEGGLSYSWSPAEFLDDANSPTPLASPVRTTEFTVEATNAEGCVASESITIEVSENFQVTIPKLFVPPVDEFWTIEGIQYYPDVSLVLVNSLGQPVLEAKGYNNSWNGTRSGAQLPSGAYYYVFKDATGKVLQSGSVSLVW